MSHETEHDRLLREQCRVAEEAARRRREYSRRGIHDPRELHAIANLEFMAKAIEEQRRQLRVGRTEWL